MTIRWARVFVTLFILTFIVSIIFVVSNHDDAMDFAEDALESDVLETILFLGFMLLLFVLVMKFLAYVVGLFRRN